PTVADPTPHQAASGVRLVAGGAGSAGTTPCLGRCGGQRAPRGQAAWRLIGDHAGWHRRRAGTTWIRAPNRPGKPAGQGVRLLVCRWPTKRPWLTPIEPQWVHGQRRVVEPARLLPATELARRVCATDACA